MKKLLIAISIVLVLIFASVLIYNFTFLKADTIIYGTIYTGNDSQMATALAIKDDKYIYVGNDKDVNKYKSKNTKVIKYDEGLILSGFTDTHTHVTPSFALKYFQIDLSNAHSVEEYISIIQDFVNKHPNEEMYIGMGWNFSYFENGTPTKDILDNIVNDKPMYFKSGDGHAAWVNTKMIEKAGVDNETPNPYGGEIVRDENGEAIGYFKDLAMDLYIKPNITPLSVEQDKKLIMEAQEYYASLGYTSYIEIFVESDAVNYNLYKAYEELDKENKLILKVQAGWNIANNDAAIDKVNQIIEYKNESKGGMFELTDIKIFMDGVVETKTAFLKESYNDEEGNYGLDRWPDEESFNRLVEVITLANKNDMVVHFHAIGDAAVTKALDAIEKAQSIYKSSTIRNTITHLELVSEDDLPRFKKLDVVASCDLSWGTKDENTYEQLEVKLLGEKRANNAYPYKSLLDSGTIVSLATDYPASLCSSPIAAYFVAINRNSVDDETLTRNANEKMTIEEALNAMTYGGAYQTREEHQRGQIKENNKADLIVLDTNIIDKNDSSIIDTSVLLTMVNGNIVYTKK